MEIRRRLGNRQREGVHRNWWVETYIGLPIGRRASDLVGWLNVSQREGGHMICREDRRLTDRRNEERYRIKWLEIATDEGKEDMGFCGRKHQQTEGGSVEPGDGSPTDMELLLSGWTNGSPTDKESLLDWWGDGSPAREEFVIGHRSKTAPNNMLHIPVHKYVC